MLLDQKTNERPQGSDTEAGTFMNGETESAEASAVDGSDPRFPLGSTVGGRYVLRRMLGRGGAASVFAAEHALVRRPVALKLPHDDPRHREDLHARLRREMSALARVRHPAVVEVVDGGEFDSMPFLAMQLLEGRTLSGLLAARGKLDPDEAIKVGVELASGLAAVHAAGIIHRDVKPSNVFVTRDPANQVRLLDFGTSKVAGDVQSANLTQAGAILGTPEYMAPEALLSLPTADHRVDVYGLGATLYELLAGAVLCEGAMGQILLKLSSSESAPVSDVRKDVPKQLADVIQKSLRRDPNERYRDISEFGSALAACSRRPRETIDVLQGSLSAVGVARAVASGPEQVARPPVETRREHKRAPYVTLACVFSNQRRPIEGRIEDLSEGGVLFVSEETSGQGEVVRLRFALPVSGRILDVAARTCWNRAYRRTRATGFEFQELPAPAREEIARYITLMMSGR
jgi:serine/threonine-protein kinase